MVAQSVIAQGGGDTKYFVEGRPCNVCTPDVFVENPATGQVYVESNTSTWRSMDAIYGQIGFTGIMWPISTLIDLVDSYIVPREVISSRADYEWPNYQSENERRPLNQDGIYPEPDSYVGQFPEPEYENEMMNSGNINWKKFTKDFEKFLKAQKKEIKKGYKSAMGNYPEQINYEMENGGVIDWNNYGIDNLDSYEGIAKVPDKNSKGGQL